MPRRPPKPMHYTYQDDGTWRGRLSSIEFAAGFDSEKARQYKSVKYPGWHRRYSKSNFILKVPFNKLKRVK